MKLKYFSDANSAAGYVNLIKENLVGISTVYHLQSPTESVVDAVLTVVAKEAENQNLYPEYVYSTFNPHLLVGLVIRERSLAFTSGKVVLARAEIVDMNPVFDESKLRKSKALREELKSLRRQAYEKMYRFFRAALEIHDDWEKIYINAMDFDKAEAFRAKMLGEIFNGVEPTGVTPSMTRRFFGSSTPVGLTDYVQELTANLNRVFIKGRPGSGKSTLMKAVRDKALDLGYDIDVYHCSLDPKSLDMVVIPELSFCIFDATAPHEYEPVFESDRMINTYDEFIAEGTDEFFASELYSIEQKYNEQIKNAREALVEANELRRELDIFYGEAVSDVAVEDLSKVLVGKL